MSAKFVNQQQNRKENFEQKHKNIDHSQQFYYMILFHLNQSDLDFLPLSSDIYCTQS